jgi:hypothetical protein
VTTEPVTTFYLCKRSPVVWHAASKDYNPNPLLPEGFDLVHPQIRSLIEQTSELKNLNPQWDTALTSAFGVGLLADWIEDHLEGALADTRSWLNFAGDDLHPSVTPQMLIAALRQKYTEFSGGGK